MYRNYQDEILSSESLKTFNSLKEYLEFRKNKGFPKYAWYDEHGIECLFHERRPPLPKANDETLDLIEKELSYRTGVDLAGSINRNLVTYHDRGELEDQFYGVVIEVNNRDEYMKVFATYRNIYDFEVGLVFFYGEIVFEYCFMMCGTFEMTHLSDEYGTPIPFGIHFTIINKQNQDFTSRDLFLEKYKSL